MALLCSLGRRCEHRNGGQRPFFGQKLDEILVKTSNFWSSPNFGPKTGLNLSEDVFFGRHLNLGRKTDLVLGWKIFILVFIILKFSEFPAPSPFENPANATGYDIFVGFALFLFQYILNTRNKFFNVGTYN